MGGPTVSGRDIVKVLQSHGFQPVHQRGSHVKLRYESEETGDVRVVTVPMHDEVKIGTLRSIAEQAGARDFQSFCDWIDENC